MESIYEEILILQRMGQFLRVYYIIMVIAIAFAFATSIMYAFGMYMVARRRGIANPWLAWVPLGNYWTMGSISDQYRYVCRGKVTNRRKILAAMTITLVALGLVLGFLYVDIFAGVFENAYLFLDNPNEAFLMELGMKALLIMGCALAIMAVDIVLMVFLYISLHDFYASCRPENKVLYLVLSILLPVTMPFFVFSCRYADGGMPPRRTRTAPQPSALPEYPRGPEL